MTMIPAVRKNRERGSALLVSLMVMVGLSVIFSRGLKVNDTAEYGGERGRVLTIGLTSVTMRAEDGSTMVRVPHLRALWHPTRLLTRDRA